MATLWYLFERLNLPLQKQERKGGWEPCFALKLTLNFRVLIQPYSRRLINDFCWGGWSLLSVSKLECQRTSGPQIIKRTKSDFIYCAQCYWSLSRKLDLPLSESRKRVIFMSFLQLFLLVFPKPEWWKKNSSKLWKTWWF